MYRASPREYSDEASVNGMIIIVHSSAAAEALTTNQPICVICEVSLDINRGNY